MSLLSEWAFRQVARLVNVSADARASQFAEFTSATPPIVFLGDSITNFGMWDEWFPGRGIANRGIGGNTSSQLLARMDTASLSHATEQVYLLIGTNDVSQGISKDVIVNNLASLIHSIRTRAPQATVFVQSVMPRRAVYADSLRELNSRLTDLAAAEGAIYIDLWPALSAPDGSLRPEFTNDHLHLTGPGYAAWAHVLGGTIS